MNPANIFLNHKPLSTQDYQTGSVNTNQQLTPEMIKQQIRSLTPGQTILGEIIGKSGSDVQIRLLDELLIQAKLDGDMNLEVGRNMTFQVKNNGSILTLSPLYENMATDATAMKALDMAGIPVTDKTLAMTNELMKQGLPIDKNSLQQVYKEIHAFPTAEAGDIVHLHKFGVEVNEANLNQYAIYKNSNNSLLQGMNSVLQDVPDILGEMAAQGRYSETADLLKLFLQLATGRSTEGDGTGVPVMPTAAKVATEVGQGSMGMEAPTMQLNVSTDAADNAIGTNAVLQQVSQEEMIWDGRSIRDILIKAGEEPAAVEKLIQQFESLQDSKSVGDGRDLLQQLFERIKHKWQITPEEIETPGKVQELYRTLGEHLTELAEHMEQAAGTHSNVYRATTNMVQNLEFLQQLNQMYTYVQLPVRLQQGEAHGDLYVYTNKKHLAAKEGQISALLHLDMEHLGPVDVYVAMQSEKLSTNFYLQDDEMLDFINEHMDILTERLAKRGYNCTCQLQVRESETAEEEPAPGIDGLLGKEVGLPISMYSFDVRG